MRYCSTAQSSAVQCRLLILAVIAETIHIKFFLCPKCILVAFEPTKFVLFFSFYTKHIKEDFIKHNWYELISLCPRVFLRGKKMFQKIFIH